MVNQVLTKSLEAHFSFQSGRQIQSGYFVAIVEIASIISDSKNECIKGIVENYPKWNDFIKFFIEKIKERFKEGLLKSLATDSTPAHDQDNLTDSKMDLEIKSFEQQEKELDDENKKSNEIKKKIPMKDVIKHSSLDYHAGKSLIHEKKEDLDHHEYDEESNDYSSLHDHPEGSKRYSNPDNIVSSSENHQYYNNNFWKSGFGYVDELELSELMEDAKIN